MTYVKAYRKANTAHGGCKWGQYLHPFLNAPSDVINTSDALARLSLGDYHLRAFLKHRSAFDINIKEVDFLVSLCNIALLIDPYESILYSATLGRLMNPNVDMKICLLSLLLKTQDEFTVLYRTCQ